MTPSIKNSSNLISLQIFRLSSPQTLATTSKRLKTFLPSLQSTTTPYVLSVLSVIACAFFILLDDDFFAKEVLIKEILKAIDQVPTKTPIDPRLSSRVSLYLQAFRYMLVLYGDKAKAFSATCTEDFASYLKAAIKTSNDVYSWSKDDRKFLKQIALHPLYLEKVTALFKKVEKGLQGTPYAVLD